jgi:hypothetical protein
MEHLLAMYKALGSMLSTALYICTHTYIYIYSEVCQTKIHQVGHQWLTPVILATLEAETWKIAV